MSKFLTSFTRMHMRNHNFLLLLLRLLFYFSNISETDIELILHKEEQRFWHPSGRQVQLAYKLLHTSASIHFEENILIQYYGIFLGVACVLPGLPWWLSSKESPANAGNADFIPGLGRYPGEGNENPLQYSCLEKSHKKRSLACYSPWGHKESDMTEQLNNNNKWVAQNHHLNTCSIANPMFSKFNLLHTHRKLKMNFKISYS